MDRRQPELVVADHRQLHLGECRVLPGQLRTIGQNLLRNSQSRLAREQAAQDHGTIFEPDAAAIFGELVPRYATAKLYAALADAFAAEHSARMVAMGSARKNAGELVDSLTLTRNRLRQAAITREIAELVGGAEALK